MMSSFNDINARTHSYSGDAEAIQLSARSQASAPAVDSRQSASQANWSNLLFAAKVAYSKGYKNDALQLYRAGLVAASRSMDQRDELIEFLTENVWS